MRKYSKLVPFAFVTICAIALLAGRSNRESANKREPLSVGERLEIAVVVGTSYTAPDGAYKIASVENRSVTVLKKSGELGPAVPEGKRVVRIKRAGVEYVAVED